MSVSKPVPGQRWVSDSEPEMGLGVVVKAEFGRVEIAFPAANERRQYAIETAPLRRVLFQEGDRIRLKGGDEMLVEAVEERGGLCVYRGGAREVPEAELSDTISFSKPEDRLLGGQVDALATFELRADALRFRSAWRQSAVRGFVGGRVDLLPHQMFIAGEVAARLVPRVLLADEVGLGKTIEAGLILHRLHLTGRADRVLIVVPEPLLHQWFVELLRRFNLLFSLFDEERCASIEQHNPEANPFLDSQLVLCPLPFLAGNPARAAQAIDAGWDLLIVDEAHHLEWTPEHPSVAYQVVESLASRTPGLLLLTATPQQLGLAGHFARLRLLDPERYSDLSRFVAESERYEKVAQAVDRLLHGDSLREGEHALFGGQSERVRRGLAELSGGDESARAHLIAALLDEFGMGRVMFRNTRAALSGFPVRTPMLAPLSAAGDPIGAKVKWLIGLLKELGTEKVLLICRTRELTEEVQARLLREINVSCGLFHEGLTLMQRDRNAAFFAEPDGARILFCSEIGSEGRNFQFVQHLVLFDLPADPELLEQRIGRLDRIGQTGTICIHVPYVKRTEGEVLARWFHEGLQAFEKNPHGASEIAREVQPALDGLRETFDAKKLTRLIQRTQKLQGAVSAKLARGHDRLLELSSCRTEAAETIIRQIRSADGDPEFEGFLMRLLDHFGVHVEDLGARSSLLLPGHLITEAFPALPPEGLSATWDRKRALSREDLHFMSIDHPLVRGAIDLLLGTEAGNSTFVTWRQPGAEALFLEIHAVAECVAPGALHVDRFLPATPLRVVVDHALAERTGDVPLRSARFEKGDVFRLLDKPAVRTRFLPAMLAKAHELADAAMRELVAEANTAMSRQLRDEIERLEDLSQRNDHVRPEEIASTSRHRDALHAAIGGARLRLDAVRLIMQSP